MSDFRMMKLHQALDDARYCLDDTIKLSADPEGFKDGGPILAWLAKLRWLRTELVKAKESIPTIESAGLADERRGDIEEVSEQSFRIPAKTLEPLRYIEKHWEAAELSALVIEAVECGSGKVRKIAGRGFYGEWVE